MRGIIASGESCLFLLHEKKYFTLFLCLNSYGEDALYPIQPGGEAFEDPPTRSTCNFKFNQVMIFNLVTFP